MNRKQNDKMNAVQMLRRLLPPVFKAAPLPLILYILISILHGLSWGVITSVQQYFFDTAAGLTNASRTFSQAFAGLAMLAAAYALNQIFNGVGNLVPDLICEKILGRLSIGIHEKMAKLPAILFEDTRYLDAINKAEEGKNNAVRFITVCFSICFFYTPFFLYMAWYLFRLKPILVLSIVIIFIPTALTQILRVRLFSKLEDESAPLRRQYEYYENCMVSREYFKETRLLGGFHYFKRLYLNTLALMQKAKYKTTLRCDLVELSMRMLSVLGFIGIVYMLFESLMAQEISIGAFAAVFNSIGLLFGIMEEVIHRHIGRMAKGSGSIENYLRFLELEEVQGKQSVSPTAGDIELITFCFRYPQAETAVIRNISLRIHKGETVALVGENGSGKSTLIRLITGLYQPQSGCVLHNGILTSELTPQALYAGTSAVFQKYQRYQMTLQENIAISCTQQPVSEHRITDACANAGMQLDTQIFPKGYNTMLSREFDGVDLSGGQWQRTAIARGLYRTHDFIVLDEPTAAIDPYEETRLYNRFAQISADKTAVIVTHRLGSVRLADRIFVLKDGEICQIGTHDTLIHQPGEYRCLYQAQQQWYEDKAQACIKTV